MPVVYLRTLLHTAPWPVSNAQTLEQKPLCASQPGPVRVSKRISGKRASSKRVSSKCVSRWYLSRNVRCSDIDAVLLTSRPEAAEVTRDDRAVEVIESIDLLARGCASQYCANATRCTQRVQSRLEIQYPGRELTHVINIATAR